MTQSRIASMGEIRPVFTVAETRQLQRGLTEKILDKAANDPQWKQQLLDDPEAAMREANFPEDQKIKQRRQEMHADSRPLREVAEVMGQGGSIAPRDCWTPVTYSCQWFTLYWDTEYGETECSISQY